MNTRIEYVRVPYWRALRPRWMWVGLGFMAGTVMGIALGVTL